ncbi:hypothetical protein DBV39_01340 [Orrella marina]|uniref:Uncharacterized protein n=1 Tax=Orrella marina TaxID=2163011 RepID=A0A2R4XFJ9_9BURK|nr:hypothetical protein DBV39_01340 [Orrella marina]
MVLGWKSFDRILSSGRHPMNPMNPKDAVGVHPHSAQSGRLRLKDAKRKALDPVCVKLTLRLGIVDNHATCQTRQGGRKVHDQE